MKVAEKEFSLPEFLNYLTENSSEAFKDEGRRRWLKIYCILVTAQSWKNVLFEPGELEQMGEVYRFRPRNWTVEAPSKEEAESGDSERDDEDDGEVLAIGPAEEEDGGTTPTDEPETYYVAEYRSGLLLLFSTASNESYRRDLGNRIDRSKGATRMWMRPNVYSAFWRGILEETNGYVYYFTGKRRSSRDTPCRIRPNYLRRMNYSGDDANSAIDELREMYGVNPETIYMMVDPSLKLHIQNDGFYAAQVPSPKAVALFLGHLNAVLDEILETSDTSKSLEFEIVDTFSDLKTASITAGRIHLRDTEIDEGAIESMIHSMTDFSFIDTDISVGSLGMTSTVIDEKKESVFDISATERDIFIVPKFRFTFESFYTFYRGVVETIDEHAEFAVLRH